MKVSNLPSERIKMALNETSHLILERVKVVAPLLDDALAEAIVTAEKRAAGFDHERFPHTRPLTIRQDARLALEKERMPGGWAIDGEPRKMGQLILRDTVTGLVLRFLKAPYSQPDQIPIAGATRARQAAWTGAPLQPMIPGIRQGRLASQQWTLSDVELLLIWAYKDPRVRLDGFFLRIVHPLEPGKFGERTLCDLDLIIPRGGLLSEKNLRFVGADQDEDLFEFNLGDLGEEEAQ